MNTPLLMNNTGQNTACRVYMKRAPTLHWHMTLCPVRLCNKLDQHCNTMKFQAVKSKSSWIFPLFGLIASRTRFPVLGSNICTTHKGHVHFKIKHQIHNDKSICQILIHSAHCSYWDAHWLLPLIVPNTYTCTEGGSFVKGSGTVMTSLYNPCCAYRYAHFYNQIEVWKPWLAQGNYNPHFTIFKYLH